MGTGRRVHSQPTVSVEEKDPRVSWRRSAPRTIHAKEAHALPSKEMLSAAAPNPARIATRVNYVLRVFVGEQAQHVRHRAVVRLAVSSTRGMVWRTGTWCSNNDGMVADNCVNQICTAQLSRTLGQSCNNDAQCPTGVKCGSEVCGGATATCSSSANCVNGRE
jgi:hypothetical protein